MKVKDEKSILVESFVRFKKRNCSIDSQNLRGNFARFCEIALLGGLESSGLEWILLFAKAKRSKNFVLGASHDSFLLDSAIRRI